MTPEQIAEGRRLLEAWGSEGLGRPRFLAKAEAFWWLFDNAAALLDAAESADRMPAALRDVVAERRRQMEVEGWSPAHDDEHTDKSLADAAACYLLYESPEIVPKRWPWDPTWWKPKDYRRNCVRAAALVIAEIERIDRAVDTKKGKR